MFSVPSFYGFRSNSGGFVGLLDDYSGAAAAYSLRLLRADYSGSAIRVRRSSDNAETDIGFDSSGELDTTALLTHVGTSPTDNGFIETWYDQSGNGNDATQATASAQPKIVNSGSVITENVKPAVQFDGSDDYLQSQNQWISGTQDRSLISVSKYIGSVPTSNFGIYALTNINNSTGTIWNVRPDGGISIVGFIEYPVSWDTYNLTFIEWSGTNISDTNYYFNTNLQSYSAINDQVVNTSSGGHSLIGVNDFLNNFTSPNLQELIIYPSDQSSNRTGIETNINDFYSIY